MRKRFRAAAAIVLAILPVWPAVAAQSQSQEEQNLEVLRNTVVNLLQALVDRGVLTKEQADAMVKSAQEKAAAQAAATAAKQKAQQEEEANAIRVPYVPEIVKDEIKKEVADQLAPEVTKQVISEGKSEGWAVPGALPDWVKRVTVSGDVRVRGEADLYSANNAQNTYLNFNAVNSAGGIAAAGDAAYLDTTVNRYYPLVRLRLDLDAVLGNGWFVGARIGTGTLVNPDSLNQVLGQYGGRYTTDIDLAYLGWQGAFANRQLLTFWGGKFPNPFFYSDLTWMPDVTFEGVAGDYRLRLFGPTTAPRAWYVTAGAIPEQDVPLTADYGPASNNKWLYAGQTGLDFRFLDGNRVRFGVAYYDFNHMAGQVNPFNGTTTNYTAPVYVQKGNTMFPIGNSGNPAVGLFALASEFHELDYMLASDWFVTPNFRLSWFGDYVKNLGYNEAAVSARVGALIPPRVQGYESQVSLGTPDLLHWLGWDLFVGYRYLERDAVVDAFTDQDYHLGGTDAKGYILGGDLGITPQVSLRLRYMPFDVIDGPPLTINVWQFEVLGRF